MSKIYQLWFDGDWGELWLDEDLVALEYLQYDGAGINKYNYQFLFKRLGVEHVRIEINPTAKEMDFIEGNQRDINKMAKKFIKYIK